MPDNKVPARPGLDQPLGFVMEKGMKKRHIVLGQKVKLAEASDEEYLLSDSSLQGGASPCSTLSPNTSQGGVAPTPNSASAQLTLEQFTDIVLAQEGIDPTRVAKAATNKDFSRKVILPSIKASRQTGGKLKPVVLTPRTIPPPKAACPPDLAIHLPTAPQPREGVREVQKRKLEGKGVREIVRETMEMGKEEEREQRPLYESIYSLAGSPGAPRLDQLHPLHLQMLGMGAEGGLGEQIRRQVELALQRNEEVLGAAPLAPGRGRRGRARGGGKGRQEPTSLPLNLSLRAPCHPLQDPRHPLLHLLRPPPPSDTSQALLSLIAKTGRDLEITRKTRKEDKSERREDKEGRKEAHTIPALYRMPEVAFTPVYPRNSLKRKGEEDQWSGKRIMTGEPSPPNLPSTPPSHLAITPPKSPPSLSPKAELIEIKEEMKDNVMEKEDNHVEKEAGKDDEADARSRVMMDLKLATTADIHGNWPLHTGVILGNLALVRRFARVLEVLDRSLDTPNAAGMSALHLAVEGGSQAVVEELCRRAARTGLPNAKGDTAVHLATRCAEPDILSTLLKRAPAGGELDLCNDAGQAALHLAVVRGDVGLVHDLLAAGAKPDTQELTAGKTPMFLAVEKGRQDIIETLLCYGASVSIPNFSGVTPLSLCSENRRLAAVMTQCKTSLPNPATT